jgi:hypothetical protein
MDTRTFELLYGGEERIQTEFRRQHRSLLDIINTLNSIDLVMINEKQFKRKLSKLQLDLTLMTWVPNLIVSGFIGSNLAPELDSFPKFILRANGFQLFEEGIEEDDKFVDVNVDWKKEGF